MNNLLHRIQTKPGYKYLAGLALLLACFMALQATAPTINVDKDGYAYMVNGVELEMPTRNAELFREAGRVIYDK